MLVKLIEHSDYKGNVLGLEAYIVVYKDSGQCSTGAITTTWETVETSLSPAGVQKLLDSSNSIEEFKAGLEKAEEEEFING